MFIRDLKILIQLPAYLNSSTSQYLTLHSETLDDSILLSTQLTRASSKDFLPREPLIASNPRHPLTTYLWQTRGQRQVEERPSLSPVVEEIHVSAVSLADCHLIILFFCSDWPFSQHRRWRIEVERLGWNRDTKSYAPVYLSFWTNAPDDFLDRAVCIFRGHLDYTRLRMVGYTSTSPGARLLAALYFPCDKTPDPLKLTNRVIPRQWPRELGIIRR